MVSDFFFLNMGDRMKEANRVIRMTKYAANRSGSKYVVGREGWKGMVVNKLMYGVGSPITGTRLSNKINILLINVPYHY